MNCWFERSVTDSYTLDELSPLKDGLGLLRGSCCPHYSDDDPVYQELVQFGVLSDGVAADDGAALIFEGTELVEVVRWADESTAYRVTRTDDCVESSPSAAAYCDVVVTERHSAHVLTQSGKDARHRMTVLTDLGLLADHLARVT